MTNAEATYNEAIRFEKMAYKVHGIERKRLLGISFDLWAQSMNESKGMVAFSKSELSAQEK